MSAHALVLVCKDFSESNCCQYCHDNTNRGEMSLYPKFPPEKNGEHERFEAGVIGAVCCGVRNCDFSRVQWAMAALAAKKRRRGSERTEPLKYVNPEYLALAD